jgi:Sec-independent protein translocase protein TatA
MTALWIVLVVVVIILLVGWRLRRAAARLDRILREELSEREAAVDAAPDQPRVEHRNP